MTAGAEELGNWEATIQAMHGGSNRTSCLFGAGAAVLDSFERQLGIEAMQVVDVTRDDDRALASGDEDD